MHLNPNAGGNAVIATLSRALKSRFRSRIRRRQRTAGGTKAAKVKDNAEARNIETHRDAEGEARLTTDLSRAVRGVPV